MSKEGVIKEIQDDNGNIFVFGEEIGSGIEGTVYLGHYKFNESDKVAVKHQNFYDPDRYESIQREIACLKKLERLLGVKEEAGSSYIVMPYYSGKNLREIMYELNGPDGAVSAKAFLSKEQKDHIAYGLLREAFAIQKAGIVYADYKPEHILIDFEKRTVSVIDVGQSFILGSQKNPHNTLQASGLVYTPPECFDLNITETENSFGTDGYILALLIAAIYSDACFELAVREIKFDNNINYGCLVREKLSDVLGENVEFKDGMPEDLFKIVRHLTQVDPTKRPEYLPLADGVDFSLELIELKAARDELLRVEEMLKRLNNLNEEQKASIEKSKEKGKEKEKRRDKIKSKAKAVLFNLGKSRSMPEVESELISEAKDTLVSSIEYPWISVDTAFKVLNQLQGDIVRTASEGKLSKEEANKCIEELESIKENFNASSSVASSASSSSSYFAK